MLPRPPQAPAGAIGPARGAERRDLREALALPGPSPGTYHPRVRRPQASAAGDEPWTMEGFQALQALDRSRRRIRLAIVGSPATAWLWAFTIDLSRQFEAGRRAPCGGRYSAGISIAAA